MKGIVIKIISILLITAFAQSTNELTEGDAIIGVWLTKNPDGKIKIFKSDDRYFGKIVQSEKMYEEDGVTLSRDVNNPDKSLRDRTIINCRINIDTTYEKIIS